MDLPFFTTYSGSDISIDSFQLTPLVFSGRMPALRYALDVAQGATCILEFGNLLHQTTRALAAYAPKVSYVAFHEGEVSRGGAIDTEDAAVRVRSEPDSGPETDLPLFPKNVEVIQGALADAGADWLRNHPDAVRFVHLGCESAEDTTQLLELLEPHLAATAVIVFGDLCDWRSPAEDSVRARGQWAAFRDWSRNAPRSFRILCRDASTLAAVEVITEGSGGLQPVELCRRSERMIAHGMGEVARSLLGEIAALHPGLERVWRTWLRSLREDGRLEAALVVAARAEVEMREAGVAEPSTAFDLELARVHKELGAFEIAVEYARRAAERSPRDAGSRRLLGDVLASLRDYEGAVAEYEAVSALTPGPGVTRRLRNLSTLAEIRPEFRKVQFGGLILQEIIDRYEFQTVLDVGSGSGDQARLLRSHGKHVVEIDYGKSSYFEKNNPEEMVIVDDFKNVDFKGRKFDCVIASHILEHQKNINEFLCKIATLVNDGGVICITVPPAKRQIVGGHLTIWNAGLLLYNMVIAGMDCRNAIVRCYGYNISVAVRFQAIHPEGLTYDTGDVDRLAPYLPEGLGEGFDGDIERLN